MSEYGEPWEKQNWVDVVVRNKNGDTILFSEDGTTSDEEAARIVACVNALQGLSPDGVRGLVEAVQDVIDWQEFHQDKRR